MGISSLNVTQFRTELQIHAKMRNPNIVQFHRAFTFKENTYVILELCPNGSVMDMMRKRKGLSLPEVRRFTIQICGAIKYMHTRNVIHRDLKMGNLFLDKDMNIKLGDFGLAAILATKAEYKGVYNASIARRTTVCGTPNYIAPEILKKGKNGHDHKVDIWAIGVIVYVFPLVSPIDIGALTHARYAMLTGHPPFQSSSQKEIYERVKTVDYGWPKDSQCINDIPNEAKDLVARLLKADAEERPEPDHIVGHPFFSMHGGNAIPLHIEPDCRFNKPAWLKAEHPRGDVLDKNHPVLPLRTLTQRCGVGQLAGDEKPFDVVGGNVDLSLYKECFAEELEETYPRVPLPKDMVYTSQTALVGWPSEQEPKMPPSMPLNSQTIPQTMSKTSAAEDDELQLIVPELPRRAPMQSHAATLRAAQFSSVPSRRTTFQSRAAGYGEPGSVQGPAPYVSTLRARRGLLNEHPVRSASTPSVTNGCEPKKISQLVPRVTRSKSATIAAAHRTQTAEPVISSFEKFEPISRQPEKERRPRVATQKEIVSLNTPPHDMNPPAQTDKLSLRGPIPVRPRPSSKAPRKGSLISADDVVECIPGTKPREVLSNLRKVWTALDTSMNDRTCLNDAEVISTMERNKDIHARTVVVKWVDYTNKYGIGYILQNGALGCILNADETSPQSCILVAGGENHLRRKQVSSYTEQQQIVPRNGPPVEFLENCGEDGLKRVFAPAAQFQLRVGADGVAEKLGPGINANDYEKRKKVSIWDKFGRYMSQRLAKIDENDESNLINGSHNKSPLRKTSRTFVRFYQRLGNVGVWGYGDGALQFNFPDHTKILVSDHGAWLDFYHLPPKAALSLKQGSRLDFEALCTRSVLSYPTAVMVRGGMVHNGNDDDREDFSQALAANDFLPKLKFLHKVIGLWIRHGGLGRLGSEERFLRWEGVAAGEGKLVWVSVGADGVDSRYEVPAAVGAGAGKGEEV